MSKQTTVRIPEQLADEAEVVARVRGVSVNALIIEALASQIERLRTDPAFTAEAQRVLAKDLELLGKLVGPSQ